MVDTHDKFHLQNKETGVTSTTNDKDSNFAKAFAQFGTDDDILPVSLQMMTSYQSVLEMVTSYQSVYGRWGRWGHPRCKSGRWLRGCGSEGSAVHLCWICSCWAPWSGSQPQYTWGLQPTPSTWCPVWMPIRLLTAISSSLRAENHVEGTSPVQSGEPQYGVRDIIVHELKRRSAVPCTTRWNSMHDSIRWCLTVLDMLACYHHNIVLYYT